MRTSRIVQAIEQIDAEVIGLKAENKRIANELAKARDIIQRLSAANLELQNHINEIRSIKS